MSCIQEEIAELQRRIEKLRPKAIAELNAKLAEARDQVAKIERESAKLIGYTAPTRASEPKVEPVVVLVERRQICREREDPSLVCNKPSRLISSLSDNTNPYRKAQPAEEAKSADVGKARRTITLSRKEFETINIGDIVELHVRRIEDFVVCLGLEAPRDIPIFRGEIYPGVPKS